MQLKGARVIVTGASSGIGRATALEFARRGARLALAARSETALHEVATEIRQRGGEAVVIPTDVTMAAQVERMTKETIRALGGIDVLVNNAGVGLNATIAGASGAGRERGPAHRECRRTQPGLGLRLVDPRPPGCGGQPPGRMGRERGAPSLGSACRGLTSRTHSRLRNRFFCASRRPATGSK